MNLQETIGHLFKLYGLRNAMFLRGDARAMLLHRGVKSLTQAIRKKEDSKYLTAVLASVFSRTVAFADSFVGLPLVSALSKKYPLSNCAYCGKMPCQCDLDRKTGIQLSLASEEQMIWTISDWIRHLDNLYGSANRDRGVDNALLRLIEEMHEVESAHIFDGLNREKVTLSERREKVALEFADLFAWIFSLAGMLNLPLQLIVEERYGGVCLRCQKCPCDCGSSMLYTERANPKREGTHSL